MGLITRILLLTVAVTVSLAAECDLSGGEASDCTWSIGSTYSLDHSITMTNVEVSCSAGGDECVSVAGDVTLTIHGGTITGSHAARFVKLESGGNLELSDVTATAFGSNAVDGGVVHGVGGNTVTLTNVDMNANVGNYGGAIWLDGAKSLSITGSTFTANSCGIDGGALRTQNGCNDITIKDTTFQQNSAAIGGALSVWDSVLNVESSKFMTNLASHAGAVDMYGVGSLTLDTCEFWGNTAGEGAAIMCWGTSKDSEVLTLGPNTEIPDADIANNGGSCKIIKL